MIYGAYVGLYALNLRSNLHVDIVKAIIEFLNRNHFNQPKPSVGAL